MDESTVPNTGQKPPIWKRKWAIAVAGVLLIIVAASLAGVPEAENASDTRPDGSEAEENNATTKPAADETPPPEPATTQAGGDPTGAESPTSRYLTFGDGTWLVGNEIKPGTYRAPDAVDCYWARLKNFDGDLDSINANGTPSGPEIVTITKADKGFETNGCGTWTSDLPRISASKTRIEDGTWLVGVDVQPGTYRARADDTCYWARIRDFKGDLNSIIANDLPSGRAVVTIKSSDKGFQTNGCGTWERM